MQGALLHLADRHLNCHSFLPRVATAPIFLASETELTRVDSTLSISTPGLGFTLTGTVFPPALWSDGQTLWAADYSAGRVLAYRLSDGSRLSGQDFDQAVMSAAGNNRPSGLWSDSQTMWVADYSASKVFAYRLSDKARASALEFDLTADEDGTPISPFGLWSDGETMFVSDWQRGEIFAYSLSGGQRQPNRNIDTSESGTSYPSGLWSDGRTLWLVDNLAKRVYAYAVAGLGSTP